MGLLIMCAAVTLFTAIDTSAKWLILAGLPPLQVVFLRYAGHFVFSLVVFVPREGAEAFLSVDPLKQALRSSMLLGSTILNFSALMFLPITVTTAIMFAGPIAVTLLSIPILGEQVGIRRLTAVLVGFAGVLIVVQPWSASFHPAMFFSLGAMLCASLYFVLTRFLAGRETNATSQIWSSGLATILMVPVVFFEWAWPKTPSEVAICILIGLFGALGHTSATAAHRFADASLLAPVVYLQLIFATIAGIAVFSQWPTIWTLVGALVIIGSGIYIWHRETRGAPPVRR
ncbi:EamA-like transporter family protein [Palleronia aestuarii]|uniref:EamA-like transporter family protein n=1 Tax=Palleronia aestuarii TaxID=568105 RepID=A0A2W7NL12_9RHOB|nr:EamA-like transporter family protein [Palleronia aestuarii]